MLRLQLPVSFRDFRGIGNYFDRGDGLAWDGDPAKPTYPNHHAVDINTNPTNYPWGNVVYNPALCRMKVLQIHDGYPDRVDVADKGLPGNSIILGVHQDGDPHLADMGNRTHRIRMAHAQPGTFLVSRGDIVSPLQALYRDGYSGYDGPEHEHIHMEVYEAGQLVDPIEREMFIEHSRITACGHGPFHALLTVNGGFEARAWALECQDYVFRCDKPILQLVHVSNPHGRVAAGIACRFNEDRTEAILSINHEEDIRTGYYTFDAIVDGGRSNMARVMVGAEVFRKV